MRSLYLTMFLLLSFIELKSQIIQTTPMTLHTVRMANDIISGAEQLGTLANLRIQFETKLSSTRDAYWEADKKGQIKEELSNLYAALLLEKDLYFMTQVFTKYLSLIHI